jgi:hypothetical protein
MIRSSDAHAHRQYLDALMRGDAARAEALVEHLATEITLGQMERLREGLRGPAASPSRRRRVRGR